MKAAVRADRRFRSREAPTGLLFRFRQCIPLGLVLSWVAAVIASHIPQESLPALPVDGKVLHVLGFFGLATLLTLLLASRGKTGLRYGLLVLLIMSAYAAFDEGTQPYFHRHGCVSDWVLDTSSAALALVVWQAMLLAVNLLLKHSPGAREMQRKINSYLEALCRKL